jgi:hypothetical protein
MVAMVVAGIATGCSAGTNAHQRQSIVSARITIKTANPLGRRPKERQFTLRCRPTGGSMPQAAQLCRDIAQHPISMLAPGGARSVCAGGPFMPVISVQATWHGRSTSLGGSPGCTWPGGTALAVYWAASRGDEHLLRMMQPRLRCDDDATLLAKPTPWRSVFACTHGLWTPHTAGLIRLAETLPQIAGLQPSTVFPNQIGVRRCQIHAGGPPSPRHRVLGGYCEVNVATVWKHPRVSFTESWPNGRRIQRHTWVVAVLGSRARLEAQRGAMPPQYWD